MEFFIRVFLHEGERVADFVPADDKEGRQWLRGKVKGYSYWASRSEDPEYLAHVYYEGDAPSEEIRVDWDAAIREQVINYLQQSENG